MKLSEAIFKNMNYELPFETDLPNGVHVTMFYDSISINYYMEILWRDILHDVYNRDMTERKDV